MKVSYADPDNQRKEMPCVALCHEVHGGYLGQVRFVPKVNMAWLHPCIDGVAEARMEEKRGKI